MKEVRFNYNKVYTVSSLQSSYVNNGVFGKNKYLGLKELVPSEEEDCVDNVTPPVNFGTKNYTFTLLISDVLLFAEHLINLVTLTFLNALVRLLFTVGDAADFRPIRKLARSIKLAAFRAQENGQRRLYLINYPECEECNYTNTQGTAIENSSSSEYCSVGDVTIVGDYLENSRILSVTSLTFTPDSTGDCPEEDINALGAALISGGDGILYFIDNQSNYQLSSETFGNVTLTNEFSGTPVLDTSGNTISYSDITFNDDMVLFGEPLSFTITIRSNIDKQSTTIPITRIDEEGCDIYDTPYDEDLVSWYYPNTGYTSYGWSGTISPASYNAGTTSIVATNITGTIYGESLRTYGSTLSNSPDIRYYNSSGVPLVSSFDNQQHEKFTRSGMSEFENGIFTIVPGTQKTKRVWDILSEYRRRKRMGKLFCGGIVNYGFIDNWLSGSLYFFQFKAKKVNKGIENAIKYCRNVVRFVEGPNRFYYRSAFSSSDGSTFTRSNNILGFPTTIVDLGPRDEFIKEICIDKNLDPNCSVSRSIGPTSFKSFGELMGLAINYRMDVSNNEFEIDNFFDNGGFTGQSFNNVFDGDLLQLISINNEAGIEEFDLQSPKYIGYSYQILDPDLYPNVFKKDGYNGPLPVTLELDEDGERVRLCLNEPGRLTESSQKVPFYLWNKKGTGFGGTSEATSDDQSWDYTTPISIANGNLQPLQGMTYGYTLTGGTNDSSDQYLLLPMTNTFSGLTISGMNLTNEIEFDVIYSGSSTGYTQYDSKYPGYTVLRVTGGTINDPTSGTLHIRYGTAGTWQTIPWNTGVDFILPQRQDYYNGDKQILSTPFQFYFGLKAGKTGLDKFIDLFGPKGAFPSAE